MIMCSTRLLETPMNELWLLTFTIYTTQSIHHIIQLFTLFVFSCHILYFFISLFIYLCCCLLLYLPIHCLHVLHYLPSKLTAELVVPELYQLKKEEWEEEEEGEGEEDMEVRTGSLGEDESLLHDDVASLETTEEQSQEFND